MRIFAAVSALALSLLATPFVASAQEYPNKPVRLVVPYAPGGPSDVVGRVVAENLSQKLGQSVVVDNKPGAGSQIGIDLTVKSKPDGYTLVLAGTDGISLLPALKQSIPYKVPDDFTFVASVAQSTNVLAVNAKLPFKSIEELIAFGKANPGKLRFGTSGVGSVGHLSAELFGKVTGVQLVHVPYAGTAPNVQALVGGFIDFSVAAGATVKPQADAGTIRVLATVDKNRHPLFPDLPTLAEAGVPGVTAPIYFAILGPADLPREVQTKLRSAVEAMSKDASLSTRIRDLGLVPTFLYGDELKADMVKDYERWRDIAKSANISLAD